jgi:DNA-binding GntR family transcriptional regulator
MQFMTTFDGGRQPLYLALARTLLQDIETGRYAIGTPLPPEDKLAERHGVSRHTVRQALRELKQEGVIWARAGIGTHVRARPETPRFFNGINTVADLLQFVGDTEMHVIGRQDIVADKQTAQQLHCQPGRAWTEYKILRKFPAGTLPRSKPLNYLQAFLLPEYADVIGRQKVITQPIYSLIEARHRVRVVEVLQEITAARLTDEMAKALRAEKGQEAMRITRCYLDRKGSIIEVGIGHYPSGRYTQRSRFLAHSAEGEGKIDG